MELRPTSSQGSFTLTWLYSFKLRNFLECIKQENYCTVNARAILRNGSKLNFNAQWNLQYLQKEEEKKKHLQVVTRNDAG